MQTESTILMLVRHGETQANLDGIWDGSMDTALTERGKRQVQAVTDYLGKTDRDIRAVYTSPLQRACGTAWPIAQALRLEPDVETGLAEYHLGSWEGKSYDELLNEYQLWEKMAADPDFAPHGGESPRQVVQRITGALQRISESHPGQRVVVVTHGGALAMALGSLLDGDFSQWRRVMQNCAVSELTLDPDPALLSFNRTDHLNGI